MYLVFSDQYFINGWGSLTGGGDYSYPEAQDGLLERRE